MIAIPMKSFHELALSMPKCKITPPKENVSWILDRENKKVGDINWEVPRISIYKEYQYYSEVIDNIGKEKFSEYDNDFDYGGESPIEFNDGEPSLTEQGKMLYDKPKIDEDHLDNIINQQATD
jgi:hypothetical protein